MKSRKLAPIDKEFTSEILEVISKHRQNAYRKINEELVTMYWEIGEYLSGKVTSEKWGSKVIETITEGIKKHIQL